MGHKAIELDGVDYVVVARDMDKIMHVVRTVMNMRKAFR